MSCIEPVSTPVDISVVADTAGCGLILEELRQIGFKLTVGDVERRLVSWGPHFFPNKYPDGLSIHIF